MISRKDIDRFADLSGDHFYAHTDATALEGTPFTEIVAHGYFILSAAAGLFVDAAKGPVLLNYGIDECRFLNPYMPAPPSVYVSPVKRKYPYSQQMRKIYRRAS